MYNLERWEGIMRKVQNYVKTFIASSVQELETIVNDCISERVDKCKLINLSITQEKLGSSIVGCAIFEHIGKERP